MKIKLFKKENNFKKKSSSIKPDLYWKIALFITLVIIILSFFFGYYLFTKINQDPVLLNTNEDGQVPTINKNKLENALNYFSERENKSSQILNSSAPVVDPSL